MGIIERGTSLESVLEVLRAAILDGKFLPGSQLKQSVIAEELGVSQGPVREALGRLSEEGLVESIPYRGMFVRKLAKRDVDEIYQLRGALETLAVKLALPKLQQIENIHLLEGLVEKAVAAAHHEDEEAAVQADLDFHRTLVQLSGNSRLLKVWDSLLAQARFVLRKRYGLHHKASIETLASNHRLVLNVLKQGDIDQIVAGIEEHLEMARVALLNNWQEVVGEGNE